MKFVDVNSDIVKEFPNTYSWLKNLEPIVENDSCEIIIRDTDHRYDSIRVEVKSRLGDYDIAGKYMRQIDEYINSHCCRCGSTLDVRCIGEYSLCSSVCRDCAEILSIRGPKIEGPELELIPRLKHNERVSGIKCRLKALDGHIFYKFSDEISYKDGHFIVHKDGAEEKVILAGVYTGLRDWKGERVYTGDIILAETKSGNKFWGLIMLGNPWSKSDWDVSPRWSGFCLAHGMSDFPSPLSAATRIEVVGNVVEEDGYMGPIPNESDYERDYYAHNKEYKFSDE